MDASKLSRYKTPVFVVTVAILIWAALGALDVKNQVYQGYVTDGNNTITRIDDGGPADVAGLEVGDYIRSIGGIDVEDTRATVARGRAVVGEVRTMVVERGGRVVNLDLRYVALTTNAALNYYGGIVVGILFLVFGVWAFLTAPTWATALLAALGISFSPALTVGPYFESGTVRTAVGVVVFLVVTAAFAFLTHFLCVFPKKKKALERRNMVWVLYGPAIVVGLLAVWLLVAQPAATSSVNVFLRAMFGLFVVVYFGASLIALFHSFFKASDQERAASGLNLLLTGAVIGLGPSIVISIVGLVAPQVVVPGAQFLPLAVGLLPVTFALAAVRGERNAQMA